MGALPSIGPSSGASTGISTSSSSPVTVSTNTESIGETNSTEAASNLNSTEMVFCLDEMVLEDENADKEFPNYLEGAVNQIKQSDGSVISSVYVALLGLSAMFGKVNSPNLFPYFNSLLPWSNK